MYVNLLRESKFRSVKHVYDNAAYVGSQQVLELPLRNQLRVYNDVQMYKSLPPLCRTAATTVELLWVYSTEGGDMRML